MSEAIWIEIIHLVPTVLWVCVALTAFVLFRSTIRDQLAPRVTKLSAFGVEVEVAVKQELDRAAAVAPAGTPAERTQTARRAGRLSEILRGARVLLVNDVPAEMTVVVEIMREIGVVVQVVTSTVDALTELERGVYHAVISDMARDGDRTAGLNLIQGIRRRDHRTPVILTVAKYEPDRGVPPYAFGITNRVDEMLNLLFDALERVRG